MSIQFGSRKGFRQAKDGSYSGFLYFDPVQQKNVRIGTKAGWPSGILTLDEAIRERGRILGRIDAKLTDARKRLEWMGRYQQFDELEIEFHAYAKKRAPNSWKSSTSNLQNYVLYWFLTEQRLNNPEEWRRHYRKFVTWLEGLDNSLKLRRTGKLKKNTINNIIKSLNVFLTFLEEVHFLGPFVKCKKVQVGREGRRGVEAIYTPEQSAQITKRLNELNPEFGLFFNLLLTTGMRSNEAIGLHVGSFSFSVPDEKRMLFKRFKDAEIPFFGYILLRDQPKLGKLYDETGKVPRKPLKGRREISPEFNRYIPLIDEGITLRVATIIEERHSRKIEPQDNLIFGFPKAHFYNALHEILGSMNLKDKDVHSCRHTFATWLTRKCGGDRNVSEDVLGHSSSDVNKRYVHLAEELEANRLQIKPGQKIEVKRLSV